MKKLALTAASAFAFALAACGSADDASEDAMADTVEMPADAAMADAAEPVADTGTSEAVEDASTDVADPTAQAGDAAEAAAADAAAAAEAATKNAEDGM